jgi:hypothetical protein
VQLQILRSLPLKDFLNFGSTGSGVSISDDSIKIWLQERLAGTENFQENVQRFISLWMELRPFQGAFAERVRHVLENLTPKGHMTLGQFGEFVKNMLKLKPPKFWRDYHWVTDEELLKFLRNLPISLMNIFLPLSWKELLEDSNSVSVLKAFRETKNLFKKLISSLPALESWEVFSPDPQHQLYALLNHDILMLDPNVFKHLVSELPALQNWDVFDNPAGQIEVIATLMHIEETDPARFLELVSKLPPLESWDDFYYRNETKIGLLLELTEENDPARFLALVSKLPPLKSWHILHKMLYLLELIEKNDPTRFLALVSQLPPFENWDSPALHGDNIKSTFSLLKEVSVLNKTLFLHLVKNLKPEDDSKDPIHVLIKECREEMAAMPEDPKS